jgi:hypothetical protein
LAACDHGFENRDHKDEKTAQIAETSCICGIVARDTGEIRVIQNSER